MGLIVRKRFEGSFYHGTVTAHIKRAGWCVPGCGYQLNPLGPCNCQRRCIVHNHCQNQIIRRTNAGDGL